MHLKIIFKIAETSIVQHEFINGISYAFKSRINVPRIIDRLIRFMSGTVSFRHRHNIKYIKLINMSDWHVYSIQMVKTSICKLQSFYTQI